MNATTRTTALLLLSAAASPAAAQILQNGNFARPDMEPWRFQRDQSAEPHMVAAVATFQDKPMFRLNPGHDGSGGWAGGALEQSVHLLPGTYSISGNFYIQNLRTGTNSSGGIITITLDDQPIFSRETTSVGGLAIIAIPFNKPLRIETEGHYALRLRFERPWRNSNPISIYHWAGDFAIELPYCAANCTNTTAPPLLNVDDFTCFIDSFAEAQFLPHEEQIPHYANCDKSTTIPILTVDDFTCFINEFARGCP